MASIQNCIAAEIEYFADRGRMYCVGCKAWVLPVERDHGIGSYEYWGCRGVHHEWHTECPDCDGEALLEFEPVDEPEINETTERE